MDYFYRDSYHMIKSSSSGGSYSSYQAATATTRFELISNERRSTITSILKKKLSYFLDVYRINRITGSAEVVYKSSSSSSQQYYSKPPVVDSGSIGDAVLAPFQFLRRQVNSNDNSDSQQQEQNIFSYYYQNLLNIKFTSFNEQRTHFVGTRAQSLIQSFHQTTSSSSSPLTGGSAASSAGHHNQEKYITYLNYYYLSNYQQNIIYLNNLILAIIILFVLFSVLILLEENDSFYNLSAITYLLLITFNLIIIIFAHNLAKQFLVYNRTFV